MKRAKKKKKKISSEMKVGDACRDEFSRPEEVKGRGKGIHDKRLTEEDCGDWRQG